MTAATYEPDTLDVEDDSPEAILELFASRGWGDGLPLVAPTKARVDAMRKAFLQVLADPDLLDEAKKQALVVTPLPGPDLEAMIRKIYATPPDIVEKVRKAIVDP